MTGTPVVDPSTGTEYLLAKTYASGTSGPAAYFAHAIDIASGAERAGFPVQIQGTGIFDTVGEEDPLVVVIGQGPCWLLRDGQLVEGTWSRPDTTAPTTFHDANGAALLLHPGRTWVELLPNTQQPNFH